MIITYHGKQFFKISQGDTAIAINPLSKDNTLKIKPTKFGSDVALCTTRHLNYDGFENTEYNEKIPFRIYGPGSYEVDGNSYTGFLSKALIDEKEYINTIYFFTLEGISFCFLGNISDPKEISEKTKEYIESVDVIFVPIGGGETLDPVQASKAIKAFAPKVVIPMDYGKDRDKNSLSTFLKEMSSKTTAEPKYVFKKSDLDTLNGHVVVLDVQ
ncbi:MAG: MBL fold metallo-hydrolase [Candidatus Pacebacteria bacterium]|nr:MBL fold metallo-hydrolase [Candidatus Paceibacterota bacterium]